MADTKTSGDRGTLSVTLVRSTIGFGRKQTEVVRGLGLRRIRHTVELPDTPEIRGMIRKVQHLVEVKHGSGGRQS
jgi:large subunit ribosomal protein L30